MNYHYNRCNTFRLALCLAATTATACGGGKSAVQPTEPVPNRAPTVTLTPQGPSSCNPTGLTSGCSVVFLAVARDPDGDPLTYTWTGTSTFSGNGYCRASSPGSSTGICTVNSPEQIVNGSVTVRDDHGHEATATFQMIGEGINHPPSVRLTAPFTLPGGSVTLEMFGAIIDPDEPNLCLAQHVVSGSATGDCRPNVAFWSSCLEGGPTVDIYRTAQSGACEVTLKVRDSAGLVGTTVTTIRY